MLRIICVGVCVIACTGLLLQAVLACPFMQKTTGKCPGVNESPCPQSGPCVGNVYNALSGLFACTSSGENFTDCAGSLCDIAPCYGQKTCEIRDVGGFTYCMGDPDSYYETPASVMETYPC
jgi:hypothetical protein